MDLPADRTTGVVVVFEVHYAHLVRLARHLVDDPGEAEDVVMDAFAGPTRHWNHVRRTEDAFKRPARSFPGPSLGRHSTAHAGNQGQRR